MRSDLVFGTMNTSENRVLLTGLASKAGGSFHIPNTRIQDRVNDVLERFTSFEAREEITQCPRR